MTLLYRMIREQYLKSSIFIIEMLRSVEKLSLEVIEMSNNSTSNSGQWPDERKKSELFGNILVAT